MAIWIEKALVKDNPLRERPGFGIGDVLLSPRESGNGADIYSNMRKLNVGDTILHLTDSRAITHISKVKSKHEDFQLGREVWYRVALGSAQKLAPELHRDCFFAPPFGTDLQRLVSGTKNRSVFFTRDLRLRQGCYLTPVDFDLLQILNAAYISLAGVPLAAFESELIHR